MSSALEGEKRPALKGAQESGVGPLVYAVSSPGRRSQGGVKQLHDHLRLLEDSMCPPIRANAFARVEVP